MNTSALTVLMTVYNPGRYLRWAVDGLLRQTFTDFTLLIIDDASTDGALQEIEKLKEPRIRIHRNTGNLGQTKSLNVGLRLADTPWIARMDADDLALPQWLACQAAFGQKQDSSVAVVSTRAGVVDEHNRLLRILNTPLTDAHIRLKSLWASPINHVGSIMRRAAVMAVGGYNEEYKIAADFDLWARLLHKGHALAVCPQISVLVRIHEQSLSAVNRLGREVAEVKDVVGRRIADESRRPMSAGELDLWVNGHYQPQVLSTTEFAQLLRLTEEVVDACPRLTGAVKAEHIQQLQRILKGKRLMSGRQPSRSGRRAATVNGLYRLWGRASAKAVLRNSFNDMRLLGVKV